MTNYIERYWRYATPADAIKEPPMVARFRIDENDEWVIDTLQGLDRSSAFRWIGHAHAGRQCQVYDAPDPGEGWRLVDIENEEPQEGDEFREDWQKHWQSRGEFSDTYFAPKTHYRRRIEQPKPEPKYVPFAWEDRDQLRGRWICLGTSEVQIQGLTNHDKFYINGICPEVLVRYWAFVDTGEPVGRKVME